MMGCNVSKIGAEGACRFPITRLRPLLLQQLAEIRTWRLPPRPAKDTPSKKGLLLEETSSSHNSSVAMPTVIGNPYGIKVATKPNHLHADDIHDDHRERMIGSGPASPSFRIFFEDAARDAHRDQIGKNEALEETDSPRKDALSKEETSVRKKVKRERKMKRNIKSVMKRREAVKNLINVKACYHPSHRSNTLPVAQKTTFN